MIAWCFVQQSTDNVPLKKPYRLTDLGTKLKAIKDYEFGKSVQLKKGGGGHDGSDFEVDRKKGRNSDGVVRKTEGAHRISKHFYTITSFYKVAEYL